MNDASRRWGRRCAPMGATLRADRGGAAQRPHDFSPLKSTGRTVKIIYYQEKEKIHFAQIYHPIAEISC
jgi:hypothetical protein